MLISATNLKQIKLSRNKITNEGIRTLCEALLYSNVQMIDLSYNDLTDNVLDSLCLLVENNRKVKGISIKGAKIDPKSRVKMIAQFKSCGVLLDV